MTSLEKQSLSHREPIVHENVAPEEIESKLLKIWEDLAKANKMRASLFNLIVFNKLSSRTDYFRTIVQKIVDRFPCRVLFISHDPDPSKKYLKTAVSVIAPEGQSTIACDTIDIGVAGPEWERVFSLVLPHLIPDLPVNLLWAEDPSKNHPLFKSLADLSNRIIFDSESEDNLFEFSKTVLSLKEKKGLEVTDLNWARLEGWRDLLVSTFQAKEHMDDLKNIEEIKIVYNARETEFVCHLKIQSMYLLAYLSSRLSWKFKNAKAEKGTFRFGFENKIEAIIEPTDWDLGSGTVIAIEIKTKTGKCYSMARDPQAKHQAAIQIASTEYCDLPYRFMLGRTASGQSLVREIFQGGTSDFFLESLHQLLLLDEKKLC
jgi:glucose-6-phosphate dehydrogenase assembly protein OpcA